MGWATRRMVGIGVTTEGVLDVNLTYHPQHGRGDAWSASVFVSGDENRQAVTVERWGEDIRSAIKALEAALRRERVFEVADNEPTDT